jgi:hypothetical protein
VSGAEKRVRARERRKEEESDCVSSLGHNGEEIRVIGQLEATHAAGGYRRRTVTVRGVARARGGRPVRPVKQCLRLTSGAHLNFKFPMLFTHPNFEI